VVENGRAPVAWHLPVWAPPILFPAHRADRIPNSLILRAFDRSLFGNALRLGVDVAVKHDSLLCRALLEDDPVIIPTGAGGDTDVVPRIIFEPLSIQLGRPIIVDNRPGAGGTLGINADIDSRERSCCQSFRDVKAI
jgi:Tripartite tricarboxylate transporter family receptor